MRWARKRLRYRADFKSRELRRVIDRTGQIKPDDLLLFSTQRNEKIRLPYFLDYYRDMGCRVVHAHACFSATGPSARRL